jgi:hypothetical protein
MSDRRCAREVLCVCVCTLACGRAEVRVCLCVRACVRACVRVCAHACRHLHTFSTGQSNCQQTPSSHQARRSTYFSVASTPPATTRSCVSVCFYVFLNRIPSTHLRACALSQTHFLSAFCCRAYRQNSILHSRMWLRIRGYVCCTDPNPIDHTTKVACCCVPYYH